MARPMPVLPLVASTTVWPGLQRAVALGGLDDVERQPVLDRGGRVEELALDVEVDVRRRQPVDPHHRRVADGVDDALVEPAAPLGAAQHAAVAAVERHDTLPVLARPAGPVPHPVTAGTPRGKPRQAVPRNPCIGRMAGLSRRRYPRAARRPMFGLSGDARTKPKDEHDDCSCQVPELPRDVRRAPPASRQRSRTPAARAPSTCAGSGSTRRPSPASASAESYELRPNGSVLSRPARSCVNLRSRPPHRMAAFQPLSIRVPYRPSRC